MYDVVIIGAGLGGLTAGAFLAKAGKRVVVIEKTDALGGRCRSVELMGHRFDIGADYFGRKSLRAFAQLGKGREVEPVGFKVLASSRGKTMTVPPGLSAVGELGRMGFGAVDLAGLGYRMGRQLALNSYGRVSNNALVVRAITENPALADILSIGAFFSGNDPENMPGHWFNLVFGTSYGYNRPFYPKKGSGRLPELLADVIKENGGAIVFHSKPERVIIERGAARGVVVDGREIESRAVVSGVGIVQTVVKLVGVEHFQPELLTTIGYYREGLSMASVFVVFRRTAKIRKKVHVYSRFSGDMAGMFQSLMAGRFPDSSMSILSCPDAVVDPGGEHICGTVKFLVPKGGADDKAIKAEAEKVIRDMDEVVPGFSESIVDRTLFTPKDYADNFGFKSVITPVAESVNYPKLSGKTSVNGLYIAGSTVLPVGGCTVSAIESGRTCAIELLKYL